jgi:hypothetical protein
MDLHHHHEIGSRSLLTSGLLTDRAQLPAERRIFAKPGAYGIAVIVLFVAGLLLLPFAGK